MWGYYDKRVDAQLYEIIDKTITVFVCLSFMVNAANLMLKKIE